MPRLFGLQYGGFSSYAKALAVAKVAGNHFGMLDIF